LITSATTTCPIRRVKVAGGADRLQTGVDLRGSAASRSGAHISASARRSLLKAVFEFARYCNHAYPVG
jgi:hypothetical protein